MCTSVLNGGIYVKMSIGFVVILKEEIVLKLNLKKLKS